MCNVRIHSVNKISNVQMFKYSKANANPINFESCQKAKE